MIKLSTFGSGQRIVSQDGNAAPPFLRWINDTVKSIQRGVNDLSSLVAMIVMALQQAGIAIETANEAKAAVIAAGREPSLINSYVVGGNVLSAAIDATDATKAIITIADHTRQYGDGTSVQVTGGTLPGLALATEYYVSYLDPDRVGGTVVYQATMVATDAGQTGDRHLVGGYTTPATDGTGGGGGTTRPPGIPSWKFPENNNEQISV